MREAGSLRVLVVHDRRAFADALCLAVGQLLSVGHCQAVHGIDDVFDLFDDEDWDVVILDAFPAEEEALGGAVEILRRWPDCRIILVTATSDLEVLAEAAAVGVDAFLPSEASLEVLCEAVVTEDPSDLGHAELLAVAAEAIRRREVARAAAPVISLTPRERELLGLLAQGVGTKEMAALLGIQLETCRGYVKSLLAKLGARTQLQAVVYAAREGLLDDDPLASVIG
jgi:DNA-binding NarL/FixJ family response regulator